MQAHKRIASELSYRDYIEIQHQLQRYLPDEPRLVDLCAYAAGGDIIVGDGARPWLGVWSALRVPREQRMPYAACVPFQQRDRFAVDLTTTYARHRTDLPRWTVDSGVRKRVHAGIAQFSTSPPHDFMLIPGDAQRKYRYVRSTRLFESSNGELVAVDESAFVAHSGARRSEVHGLGVGILTG